MEENEDVSVDAGRGAPHRRTVLKGAAWSIPVIAAAAAVPAYAASPCTPPANKTIRVDPTGSNRGELFITPAEMEKVSEVYYTVVGGAGGRGYGGVADNVRPWSNIQGHGAVVQGVLYTGSAPGLKSTGMTLVAGQMGGGYTAATPYAYAGGKGFGNGGDGSSQSEVLNYIGGGGGGGSALLVGPVSGNVGNPLIVAGGGAGGMTTYNYAGDEDLVGMYLDMSTVGDAGPVGGAGADGAAGESRYYSNGNVVAAVTKATGGTQSAPGAGATAWAWVDPNRRYNEPAIYSGAVNGVAGSGRDGGSAPAGAFSGGGGGGYFGGGSGAMSAFDNQIHPSKNGPHPWQGTEFIGTIGGGGSSFARPDVAAGAASSLATSYADGYVEVTLVYAC